ncbi:MAG: ABC transporter permease [Acidimicrobiales bacterium]
MVARVRSDWQYRTSFVLLAFSQALVMFLDLAAILILFELVPSLGGWSVAEVAVLYGLTILAFGLGDLFVSPVETVARHVREGSFDRFLLRPMPVLVQVSAQEFALRRAGKTVPGLVTLVVALAAAEVAWTPDRVVVLVLSVATGVVLFGSVWVLTSSVSLWVVGVQEVANAFTYGGSYAHQYPLHVFAEWIRAFVGWILPLAFVAYVPAIYLLDAANPLGLPSWFAWCGPGVALVAALVARAAWGAGIRNYQSTGS